MLFRSNERGTVVDQVEYDRIQSGISLARGENGSMFRTSTPTPGEENNISPPEATLPRVDISPPTDIQGSRIKEYPPVRLEEISGLDMGTKVSATGTVAVRPGVLGEQYFYMVGSPGVQVYNFDKEFPELEKGDVIRVQGEISESRYEEKRINTSEKEDIQPLKRESPPSPERFSCSGIDRGQAGRLVRIQGEVERKEGNKVYVGDKTTSTLVYLQEGVKIGDTIEKEGSVEITGIVSGFQEGVRILPRSEEDVQIKEEDSVGTSSSQVKGTSTSSSSVWTLPSEQEDNNIGGYFLIGTVTVVIVGGVVLWRKR